MKMDLPERTEVRVIIRGSFGKLIEELGEIEAKEDIDEVLGRMSNRNYYEDVLDTSIIISNYKVFNKRTKKQRIK